MPIVTEPAPCWRLVDADGNDYPEDPGAAHHATREEAEAGVAEWDTNVLTVQPFDRPCVMLLCDGCGDDPEDDEYHHVHFPDEATTVSMADVYDFTVVNGRVWCEPCRTGPHPPVGDGDLCDRCGLLAEEDESVHPALR